LLAKPSPLNINLGSDRFSMFNKKAGHPPAPKLAWAVGIPRHLKVYPADVRMTWPVAGRGRPRQRHVPNILSMAAEDMLADARWRNVTWRTGTKGKLKARFAAVRERVADGPPQRIRDKGQ
jgi:DDE superfamily endonuclease